MKRRKLQKKRKRLDGPLGNGLKPARKQNLKVTRSAKQTRRMDTRRAFRKTSDDNKTLKYHVAFLDSAADTCGIGGPSWYIDETSDRTVTIEGYDSGTSTKENIPIGTGLTVIDLRDGESILLRVHEATVFGGDSKHPILRNANGTERHCHSESIRRSLLH